MLKDINLVGHMEGAIDRNGRVGVNLLGIELLRLAQQACKPGLLTLFQASFTRAQAKSPLSSCLGFAVGWKQGAGSGRDAHGRGGSRMSAKLRSGKVESSRMLVELGSPEEVVPKKWPMAAEAAVAACSTSIR